MYSGKIYTCIPTFENTCNTSVYSIHTGPLKEFVNAPV